MEDFGSSRFDSIGNPVRRPESHSVSDCRDISSLSSTPPSDEVRAGFSDDNGSRRKELSLSQCVSKFPGVSGTENENTVNSKLPGVCGTENEKTVNSKFPGFGGTENDAINKPLKIPFADVVFEEKDKEAFRKAVLEDQLYSETILHHLKRPDRSLVPSYLKVGKQAADDLVLQQLDKAQVPWFELHQYDVDALVKQQVAVILAKFSKETFVIFKGFRQASIDAKDDTIYTAAIQAAVAFVYLLYNKVSLFRMGHKHTSDTQLNQLWTQLTLLGKKADSPLNACKLIAQLVTDTQKYSFVTEEHVADMLGLYLMQPKCCDFVASYIYAVELLEKNPEIVKDRIFLEVHSVIKEMNSPPEILKDDHYTRVLMNILRDETEDEHEWLIDEAMKILHKNTPNTEIDEELILGLHIFLRNLINYMMEDLKMQLMTVLQPLFEIYSSVDFEICEIIQVAELRRMTQGCRFIGRSHLIWAFYECGYGLPSVLRERIKLSSSDEDHPPYYIYVAAMRLAALIGAKKMPLLCFVFAVLFSNDIGFDDEKKLKEMGNDLKCFMVEPT